MPRLPRVGPTQDPSVGGGIPPGPGSPGGVPRVPSGGERIPQISTGAATAPSRAEREFARALLEGGQRTFNIGIEMVRVEQEFRRTSEAISLRESAANAISELEFKSERDPDFANHASRVSEGLTEIREGVLAQTDDREVHRVVRDFLSRESTRAVTDARAFQFNSTKDASLATLVETLDSQKERAAKLTGEALASELAIISANIAAAVQAGFISRTKGVELERSVLHDIASAQSINAALDDPVQALLDARAGKFDFKDEESKARFIERTTQMVDQLLDEKDRLAQRQEREERRKTKERQEAVADVSYSKASEGNLTVPEIEELRRKRLLVGEDYRRVRDMVLEQGEDGPGNIAMFNRFNNQIIKGEPVTKGDIADAQGFDGLNSKQVKTLMGNIDEEKNKHFTALPEFKQGLRDIERNFPTSEFSFNEDVKLLEAIAIQEYHDLVQNGARPIEASRTIINQYQGAIDTFTPKSDLLRSVIPERFLVGEDPEEWKNDVARALGAKEITVTEADAFFLRIDSLVEQLKIEGNK